jgi:hypothetical protein
VNKARIAAVVLVRFAVASCGIYLLNLYYPFPQSALNYSYALLIGVGVMLLDPRGATAIVKIMPDAGGRPRMVAFIERQNRELGAWRGKVNEDGTGTCIHYLPAICPETLALFGPVFASFIRDAVPPPNDAQFSVSVESGVVNL